MSAAQVAVKKQPPQVMVKAGNGWLIAVAAFTALNTVLYLLEMNARMLIGLVSTLAFLYRSGGSTAAVGTAFVAAAVLGGLAYLTSKGSKWPLLVATVVYVGDTIVTLYYMDWLGLLWHALALFFLIRGIVGMRQMGATTQFVPGAAGFTPAQAPVPAMVGAPTPAAWLPDPSGKHELRYHDGSGWTAHVSDAGAVASDPLG